jgi:hypothetical protein
MQPVSGILSRQEPIPAARGGVGLQAAVKPKGAALPATVGTAGAVGTMAWLMVGAGPEFLAEVFLVAAPIRIVTGYMDLPSRLPRLRGRIAPMLSMGSVAALNSMPSLVLGMAGMYTEGRTRAMAEQGRAVPASRIYADLQRCRQQLWWWASAVAVGTLLITADVRRALAVMLAGNPSALVTALAIAAWREQRHWQRTGVTCAHPLALMAAGEVDMVVFDLPACPEAPHPAELRSVVAALHARGYAVGFTSDGVSDELRALAREVRLDAWCVGGPSDRARWVQEQREQGRRVAVVGFGWESLPAMSAANLTIAVCSDGPPAKAAHVTVPAGPAGLPALLAENRRHSKTAGRVITLSRSLAVAATVATAVGILGAANLLTAANIVGLGLISVNQALRKRRSGHGRP